jgi:hypothetical protein
MSHLNDDHKYDVDHDEAAYPHPGKAGSDVYVDTYVEGTDAGEHSRRQVHIAELTTR